MQNLTSDNFEICVSAFNADINWLKDYPYKKIVYDKTWGGARWRDHEVKPLPLDCSDRDFEIIKSIPQGFNIYDYMQYIISRYDSLPECVAFIKANIIGRHVRKSYFDLMIKSRYLIGFEDLAMHDLAFARKKKSFINFPTRYNMLCSDGGFMEVNNDWYLRSGEHPTKHFHSYDDLMNTIFSDYIHVPYIRFAPGANYVVPRANILRFPLSVYQLLSDSVMHHQLSGESYIIERALWSLWSSNFTIHSVFT